ncbi:MAG: ABC transporter permease [Pirellula sp.]|jgi:putative ABC transport system permease protein|nr:ABC transporter permease [Pirellula sp.]
MNLFAIAIRNLMYRPLASLLTALSMALGVALVVLVLTISGVIEKSLERTSNVGYNLIIGSKGSPIQLVFNTVFFLSKPVENIPYSYYMEYLPGDGRQKEFERIGGELKDPERNGLYSFLMKGGFAIPICMGDYVDRFRCVATTPDYFEQLKHGDANDLPYTFSAGRNFVDYSEEHGFFEAVVGAEVAESLKLKLGDQVYAAHGAETGDTHSQGFTVVGILDRTGSPNDRGAFVNIEGFYLLEGHVAPDRDEESGLEKANTAVAPERESALSKVRLPIHQREVTAILLKPNGFAAIGLEKQVNKTKFAQAVSPIAQIEGLLGLFVRPLRWALLALTSLVCIVSAISILVSIYNSMNERKKDIAVMRALGASRDHITAIILLESLLIALAGGLVGWLAGHALGPLSNPWTMPATGVKIDWLSFNSTLEPLIIPGLVLIGTLAGVIPAVAAYRTPVAKSL